MELELRLGPEPREEWVRLLRFVGWGETDRRAAGASVEALLRRAPEIVASTYEHLASVPETAAVLGWESAVDADHLEERRRFFTIWLARTLGLDTSEEMALYLFRGGTFHAAHGPRRVHVPPGYVTAAFGLVQASFARCMAEAGLPAAALAGAVAAWSKYLGVQLELMQLGYRAAVGLDAGTFGVTCRLYGRMRGLVGRTEVTIGASDAVPLRDLLVRFFDYFPLVRAEALERIWEPHDDERSGWREAQPLYRPRDGWRLLVNGRDVRYGQGFETIPRDGDELALFPPGR